MSDICRCVWGLSGCENDLIFPWEQRHEGTVVTGDNTGGTRAGRGGSGVGQGAADQTADGRDSWAET